MELSCHGGSFLLHEVLQAVLEAGARTAQPGEFTRRALENGKMSLTQAEAVMDLIGAQGQTAAKAALAARDGVLYQALQPLVQKLLDLQAHLTALIDFPEEDLPELSPEALKHSLEELDSALTQLLEHSRLGRTLQRGVSVAIVGRPNVGKSSLMNLLAGHRRSIVTSVPGTTRDVVEEILSLDGLMLRLADTAGIRETKDLVEQEGVAIAKERLEKADLVLAVFDLSAAPAPSDWQVLELLREQGLLSVKDAVSRETSPATPLVVVWNKSDLSVDPEMAEFQKELPDGVVISAKEGKGSEALWEAIRRGVRFHQLDPNTPLLANQRQVECARRALESLKEAQAAFLDGWTMDAVSVAVEEALEALLELSGERASQKTIDQVFQQFCVGK